MKFKYKDTVSVIDPDSFYYGHSGIVEEYCPLWTWSEGIIFIKIKTKPAGYVLTLLNVINYDGTPQQVTIDEASLEKK